VDRVLRKPGARFHRPQGTGSAQGSRPRAQVRRAVAGRPRRVARPPEGRHASRRRRNHQRHLLAHHPLPRLRHQPRPHPLGKPIRHPRRQRHRPPIPAPRRARLERDALRPPTHDRPRVLLLGLRDVREPRGRDAHGHDVGAHASVARGICSGALRRRSRKRQVRVRRDHRPREPGASKGSRRRCGRWGQSRSDKARRWSRRAGALVCRSQTAAHWDWGDWRPTSNERQHLR